MRRARLHLVHLLSGMIIAILLGIHMVIQHLDKVLGFFGMGGGEPTSWLSVAGRSSRGIWVGLYVALLAFVLYHALYGLRGVILETTSSAKAEKAITVLFILAGIIVFVWSSYVPLALFSR